jgi:hypothetical protein
MPLVTRSELAGLLNVNKSTVTRWGHAGRLVEVDGLCDVEACKARIAATQGVRHDVSDRWAGERGPIAGPQPADPEPQPAGQSTQGPGEAAGATVEGLSADTIGLRTRHAQMRRAESEAAAKELDRELAAGSVVPRADVRRDMTAAVSIIHQTAETLPDRLAPLLVSQTDLATVRAILRDEIEHFMGSVADRLDSVARDRSA